MELGMFPRFGALDFPEEMIWLSPLSAHVCRQAAVISVSKADFAAKQPAGRDGRETDIAAAIHVVTARAVIMSRYPLCRL
jgi:hypothetical protein